jgi:hypothetical protein
MIRRAPIRIQVAAAFAAAMAVVLLATGLARCASVMHIMDPELRRRMDRMYRNGAVAGVVGLVIVAVLFVGGNHSPAVAGAAVITALFAAARSGRAAEARFSNWPPAHERRTLGP